MKNTCFRTMVLILATSTLLGLSGCGSTGVESDQDLLGTTATPPVVTPPVVTPPVSNTPPNASDFNMTLDINVSAVTNDWKILSMANDSDGDDLSASVMTQGNYGTFFISGDSVTYTETIDGNSTDEGILEISDGSDSVQVTITVNKIYWKQVSAAGSHTAAIKSDGTLWSWGQNNSGQLGNGNTTDSSVPVQESSMATNWSFVGVGSRHSAAIKADGTLWTWGSNNHGQLGDGSNTDSSVPVQESSMATNWTSVDGGFAHTSAIRSDGTLWTWGYNNFGQLGNGNTADALIPVQENSMATNWHSLSAGIDHTAAIKTDGTFWLWGFNSKGQLCDGSTTNSSVPVQESTKASNWDSVGAGSQHTAAIKTDNTVWSCGSNQNGQLGIPLTTTESAVPVQESSQATNWHFLSTGEQHTVVIKSDSTLWSWGLNDKGQLGDGTSTNSAVPVQEVLGDMDWSIVDGGQGHTAAIKSNGMLWLWGNNNHGQLGDGTTGGSTNVPAPLSIP